MSRSQPTVRDRKPERDPLKICLLTYRGNPTCGGQGIYVKRISRALRDLGHSVSVVSGPPYPDLDEDIVLHRLPSLDLYNPEDLFRIPKLRELRSPINTLEWIDVSTGGFPEPLTFSLRAYGFLRHRVGSYDVLHDNQCISYGILGMQHLGFPTVATIHHPVTIDRDTELQAAGRWWKRLKVRRWYSFLGMQARVARRLSCIITVSESSKHDISKAFRIPAERFRVIPNGVSTEVFHPLPHVQRDRDRIMVTTSADTPVKGLRYLLQATASVARKRRIRLTVIGTPKKDGEVSRLVKDLRLHSSTEFTGRIEDKEFAQYYARSAIAVVPSLYEGFGFPAAEAMACGVPVISTTGGALPEVVGDAGILVPPGDAQALEEAILGLLDNPDRCGELSRAGYQRVQKHFTWQAAAHSLLGVYRETLHDNGRFRAARS
jgi:glycosyltransferase involved in cell wall biosynthesis